MSATNARTLDDLDSLFDDEDVEMSATNAGTPDENLDSFFVDKDVNFQKMSASNAGIPNDSLNSLFVDDVNLQEIFAANAGTPYDIDGINLQEVFGPYSAPEFPLSPPQVFQQGPVELAQSVSADLPSLPSQSPTQPVLASQVQANNVHADVRSANTHHPNQHFPAQERSLNFYPDPSQPANEVSAGPYFDNAATPSRTPYQIQEPLRYANAYQQHAARFNQGMPSQKNRAQGSPQLTQSGANGQMPHSNGAPPYGTQYQQVQGPPLYVNQGVPLQNMQNMPAPNQHSPPSQPQSAINSPRTQPHNLTSYQNPVHVQKPPEPGFYQRSLSVERNFDTSKRSKATEKIKKGAVNRPKSITVFERMAALQIYTKRIECSDYQPLAEVPESWECFKYNANGELERGRTYSAEEIERYLFHNPRHFTSNGYNPKLGGLTLWIQRAPQSEDQCHMDPLADRCRFECCEHAGKISRGQLRVAFDEQTRNFPNHNPQHNVGYVHLKCLETFLVFPNICAQLIVKAEDRVLSNERFRKNCMILQTVTEADHFNRFIDFCSTNGRGPALYPSMNMNIRAHSPEHTLKQEIQALGATTYSPLMQQVWETQGRIGIILENERNGITKKQRRIARARPQAQAQEHKEPRPAELPEEQATVNPASRGKKRMQEPESDSEFELESNSAQNDPYGLKRRETKRARISEPESLLQRNRVGRKRRNLEAELETRLKEIQYNQRVRKRGQGSKRPPTSQSTASSSEHEQRRRKRTRECRPRQRALSPRSSSGNERHFEPEKKSRSRGSSVEKQRRVSQKGSVAKPRRWN